MRLACVRLDVGSLRPRTLEFDGRAAQTGTLILRFCLALAAVVSIAAAPAERSATTKQSLHLAGVPLQMVSALGALWVLTCDRGCSGEARDSRGEIVRIDPHNGRVTASAELQRPGAVAIGATGIYATDFWRDTVRRIDPRTPADHDRA